MSQEEAAEVMATPLEALPDSRFMVAIDDNQHAVLAHISGKMRKRSIRILPGDKVLVELSRIAINRAG